MSCVAPESALGLAGRVTAASSFGSGSIESKLTVLSIETVDYAGPEARGDAIAEAVKRPFLNLRFSVRSF